MKEFLKIYRSAEGQGNIGYDDAPADATLEAILNVNDGLSRSAADPTVGQLGQAVGRAGDPAVLLEDREIPDGQASGNHFGLFLGRNNGVDDVALWSTFFGFRVSNKTGFFSEYIGVIGGQNSRISMFTTDGQDGVIEFAQSPGGSLADIVHNGDAVNPARFDVAGCPWIMDDGLGHGNTTKDSIIPVYALLGTDSLLLIDTAAGNLQINIGVVAGKYANQRFVFKKVSLDVNTITLNMTAGTIQGNGAAAPTFVFNNPGESIEIYVDAVNAYII